MARTPYTNFHDLNLNWIIEKIKTVFTPDNPPPYPVTSVNQKTGAVELKGTDIPVSANDSQTIANALASKYEKPASGIPASDLAPGVIPDPTSIIDDNAGSQVYDKTWSAHKLFQQEADILDLQNDKQDAPASAGTAGQVLSLNSSLQPEWVDMPEAQMIEAVDDWLSENITNPSNPPLDRSLSIANACAPADLVGDLKNQLNPVSVDPNLRNGTTTNIYNAQQVATGNIIPFAKSNTITILINKAVSAPGNFWRLVFDTFSVESGNPEDNASNRVTITNVQDTTKLTIYKGFFDSTAVGFAFSIAEKTAENGTVTHRIDDFSSGDIVIIRDYAYLNGIENEIEEKTNDLQNNIDNLSDEFHGAITAHKNYLEGETPESGYIYSRTTGNKSANQYGVVFEPVPVKSGVTYYYKNIYAYFSVFISDNTVTPLSEDSTYSLSGSFNPNADGEIRITKHIDDNTDTLFTDSQDLYLSGSFNTYYTANNLEPNFIVNVGAGREYARLRDGIEEAVKHKNSIVYVDAGTYDLVTEFAEEIADNLSGVWFGNPLYNGIHIIFRSGAKVICNYTGGIENITTYFNPFIAIKDGNFTLENLDISVKNVRYCVHDERSSSAIPRTAKYINCKMEMDNTTAVTNWYPQCIGGGNGCHDYIDIQGCWFKSKKAETDTIPLVSYHNNNSGTIENKSNVNVSDCYFSDKGTFRVTYSGPATEISRAMIHNCSLGSILMIGQENPSNPAPENYEIIEWLNEIRS